MPAGYRPCSFLAVPKEFGKRGDDEWRLVTKADESSWRSPTSSTASPSPSVPSSATTHRRGSPEESGHHGERTTSAAKLIGQLPLHLTELMELAFRFGPPVLPFRVQRSTLLPHPDFG